MDYSSGDFRSNSRKGHFSMLAQLIPKVGGAPITLHRAITVIGRSSRLCDLVIDHTSVSKQHCLLVKTDGLIYFRDLGSTNGTRVNGQRVIRGALLPGDGYDVYVKPFRTIEDIHVHAATIAYLVAEGRRRGWPHGWIERAVNLLLLPRVRVQLDQTLAIALKICRFQCEIHVVITDPECARLAPMDTGCPTVGDPIQHPVHFAGAAR